VAGDFDGILSFFYLSQKFKRVLVDKIALFGQNLSLVFDFLAD